MSEHEFLTLLKDFDSTIMKLGGAYTLPGMDHDDICQELRINLFNKYRKQGDTILSFNNWAYITCRHKLTDMYRYATRKKRDYRLEISLDEYMVNVEI